MSQQRGNSREIRENEARVRSTEEIDASTKTTHLENLSRPPSLGYFSMSYRLMEPKKGQTHSKTSQQGNLRIEGTSTDKTETRIRKDQESVAKTTHKQINLWILAGGSPYKFCVTQNFKYKIQRELSLRTLWSARGGFQGVCCGGHTHLPLLPSPHHRRSLFKSPR